MSVDPRAKKFDIVSNDNGHARKYDFFPSRPKIPFLGKFSPKYQNFQFELKFGTKTNSIMQNSKAHSWSETVFGN